jgi:tetratricopeptide (TPR) repeat protein
MHRLTLTISLLLMTLVLFLFAAPLVQRNTQSLQVKSSQAERLADWQTAPPAPDSMSVGDGCAYLGAVADFPAPAVDATECDRLELTALWSARVSWRAGDTTRACQLWQSQDAWLELYRILERTVSAATWDDVSTALSCLEGWSLQLEDEAHRYIMGRRVASAYMALGAYYAQTGGVQAALNAFAAADRWDPDQRWRGASSSLRLLVDRGDLPAALDHLQTTLALLPAEAVMARYGLWMEMGNLVGRNPARADEARDAFDTARRLRPDQTAPYTSIAALYRNSRPDWSVAVLQAGLKSAAGATPAGRRVLLRTLADLHRAQGNWNAAACAYRIALAQSIPDDKERPTLQEALAAAEARLAAPPDCSQP